MPQNFKNSFLQVDDPSKYGVVVTDEDCKVERFVEKPKVGFLGSTICAGFSALYLKSCAGSLLHPGELHVWILGAKFLATAISHLCSFHTSTHGAGSDMGLME